MHDGSSPGPVQDGASTLRGAAPLSPESVGCDVVPTIVASSGMDVPLGSVTRPSWRGRLHLGGLCAAVPLVAILAVIASGARARTGVIVYGVCLCAMLAVSVTYHRWVHTVRARARWRRADHATIFAAIGGTFTPLCLLSFGTAWGVTLLTLVWAAALAGVVIKVVGWRHAQRVGIVLYLGIGWSGALLIPAVWSRSGSWPAALLLAGGAAYTLGAIGFVKQWPALGRTVFSYHEVWHAFTIVAAGAHLATIWIVTS